MGTKDYPGLAYKSLRRLSWILWSRKKENLEKLKALIQEYNDIFEVCVKENYIEMKTTEKGLMPSTATPLADEISGILGLLQGLLSRYRLAWTVIIIPLIIGILKLTNF